MFKHYLLLNKLLITKVLYCNVGTFISRYDNTVTLYRPSYNEEGLAIFEWSLIEITKENGTYSIQPLF